MVYGVHIGCKASGCCTHLTVFIFDQHSLPKGSFPDALDFSILLSKMVGWVGASRPDGVAVVEFIVVVVDEGVIISFGQKKK